MNDKPRVHPRLHFLLSAACEEQLTAAQVAELELLMRGDPKAQRLYHEYCQLHVDLHFVASGDQVRNAIRAKIAPSPVVGVLADCWHRVDSLVTLGLRVAWVSAILAIGLLVLGSWLRGGREWGEVATLGETFRAEWSGMPRVPAPAAGLIAGQPLKLKSGFATIRFHNGAEVLLEGPATFTPEDVNAGQLLRGKLVGRVTTKDAQGFTVHTPTAMVVDQGTEFSVAVDHLGQTEACVFKGRVEARLMIGGRPGGDVLRVESGQAVRADLNTGQLTRTVPQPDAFVRSIPTGPPDYTRAVLATRPARLWGYWRWEEYPLSMSGSPTVAVNIAPSGNRYDALWGGKDLVPRCVPVGGVAGPRPRDGFLGLGADNRAAQLTGQHEKDGADMLQFGSIWLEARNALDEKFDVPSQTIAFFMKTSQCVPDARIFVAHPANQHDFQIVMSDARLGVTTRDDSAEQTVMTASVFNDDQWHHVVVVRNGDLASNARLYVDGPLVPMEPVDRSFSEGGTSRFGTESSSSAWWVGFLDEIAVWDSPLDEAEVAALYQAALGVARPVVHSGNL